MQEKKQIKTQNGSSSFPGMLILYTRSRFLWTRTSRRKKSCLQNLLSLPSLSWYQEHSRPWVPGNAGPWLWQSPLDHVSSTAGSAHARPQTSALANSLYIINPPDVATWRKFSWLLAVKHPESADTNRLHSEESFGILGSATKDDSFLPPTLWNSDDTVDSVAFLLFIRGGSHREHSPRCFR